MTHADAKLGSIFGINMFSCAQYINIGTGGADMGSGFFLCNQAFFIVGGLWQAQQEGE